MDGPASPSGEQLEGKALLQDRCSVRVAQTLQPLGSAGLHNTFDSQGDMSYLSVPATIFQGRFSWALSHVLNKSCNFYANFLVSLALLM